MENKRLLRSRKNRIIAGVCGGLADYLRVDPTVVRLAAVLVTLFGGSGILAYIILWAVLPEEGLKNNKTEEDMKQDVSRADGEGAREDGVGGQALIGALLVLIGAIMLLNNLFPALELTRLWPIGIIVFGIWLLIKNRE